MPKRRKSTSRRTKTGLDLLAAVLVAIGAVLCIIFGILLAFHLAGSEYAFGFIGALIDGFLVIALFAIVFGVIIIVIEGYNKLYDFWSIIFIFILAIFAGTVGALLIIIGCLLAIIQKVRKD